MAGAYQLGYRVAIMVASAGALWIAAEQSFGTAYAVMGAFALVGILTTLFIPEPQPRVSERTIAQEQRVIDWLARNAHLPVSLREAGAWFTGAVVCPFVDFFGRYGTKLAILILAFAASYRLTDFTMGVMANPFYIDVGYTLKEIAAVAKGFGLISSIAGVLIGGVVVARLGTVRSLVLGSLLVITSNLMFMTLAWSEETSLTALALVVSADNLAMGVAGTALIAYLSSLTSPSYTATQYALFSSAYALPGKLLMGGSGFVVDQAGYPWFFVYTSFLGLPALLLLWLVVRQSSSVAYVRNRCDPAFDGRPSPCYSVRRGRRDAVGQCAGQHRCARVATEAGCLRHWLVTACLDRHGSNHARQFRVRPD